MICKSCDSFRPHKQDFLKIRISFDRVEDRLKILLSDNRDKVVPSVMDWILNGCDVNKDIEIDEMAHLTLPDIQISMAEKSLRGYVKVIDNRAHDRGKATYAK